MGVNTIHAGQSDKLVTGDWENPTFMCVVYYSIHDHFYESPFGCVVWNARGGGCV